MPNILGSGSAPDEIVTATFNPNAPNPSVTSGGPEAQSARLGLGPKQARGAQPKRDLDAGARGERGGGENSAGSSHSRTLVYARVSNKT